MLRRVVLKTVLSDKRITYLQLTYCTVHITSSIHQHTVIWAYKNAGLFFLGLSWAVLDHFPGHSKCHAWSKSWSGIVFRVLIQDNFIAICPVLIILPSISANNQITHFPELSRVDLIFLGLSRAKKKS